MASAPDQLAERRLTLAAGGRVLVVGGGGGRDIYDALSSGARRVDVIELNRTIVDVVDKDLAYFSGAPYSLPAVHTTAGDGRAILAARQTKRSLPAGRSLGVGDQRFRLVLAAAVATFTAINWGFAATTFVALACYLVALADAGLRPWPTVVSTENQPAPAVSKDRSIAAAGVA